MKVLSLGIFGVGFMLGMSAHAASSDSRSSLPDLIPPRTAGDKLKIEILDIVQLDRAPQAKSRTPVAYPVALRRAGVTGSVVIEFMVDTTGTVQDPFAVESTRPEFEQSAIQAVKQWKFTPGIMNGREVNTRMRVPIHFTLQPGPQKAK